MLADVDELNREESDQDRRDREARAAFVDYLSRIDTPPSVTEGMETSATEPASETPARHVTLDEPLRIVAGGDDTSSDDDTETRALRELADNPPAPVVPPPAPGSDRALHPEDYEFPPEDSEEERLALQERVFEPRTDEPDFSADETAEEPGLAEGQLSLGNIDLHSRPVVHNDDGTYSTVRSMSFNDGDGREVLIPTIGPRGETWTDEEAIQHYRETGENLGVFETPEAATAYAQRLHEDQAQEYADDAAPETGVDPEATVDAHEPPIQTGAPSRLPPAELAAKQDQERAEVAALDPAQRLDRGLPSEGDIQRERDLDPFRRVLHALASGLSVAARRGPIAYDNRAQSLSDRREQGLRERLGLKAHEREQDEQQQREDARATLSAQQRAESQAATLAQGQARLDLQQSREQRLRDQAQATTSRTERERIERADYRSGVSRTAQRALRAAISQLPQSYQDTFNAQLPEGGIDRLSANDAQAMLARVPQVTFRARPSGVGHGAGSARGTAGRDVLRRHLMNVDHLSETEAQAEVDALDDAHVQSRIATIQADRDRRGQGGADLEHFTVAAPSGQDPLTLSTQVYADPVSQRQVSGVLSGVRSIVRALGEIDRLRGEYSAAEIAIPGTAAHRAMSQAQSRLATAQSAISNAGTINAGEREIYLQDSPPGWNFWDSLTGTDRTYRGSLDAWRGTLEGTVRDIVESGGVSPRDRQRFMDFYLRGFPGRTEAPTHAHPAHARPTSGASDTVRIRRVSDGQEREIPRSAWRGQAGYEEVR